MFPSAFGSSLAIRRPEHSSSRNRGTMEWWLVVKAGLSGTSRLFHFYIIRLRPNTLSRFIGTAGMKGKVNRAVARQSEGGFGYVAIPL